MAVSNRRITVVVDGNSAELQSAVKAAVASVKELGSVLADQSKIAVDWGETVVKSNEAVAASYGRAADAAKASIGIVNAATKTQITAQGQLARAAVSTSDEVAAAAEKQASAMRTSTGVFDDTSKAQVDALASVAAEAARSSSEVVLAADRQAAGVRAASVETAAASDRSAASVTSSAAKQNAGFAATGSGLVRLGKVAATTAAAVAAGSVYMSAKFESSTNRLLTQAGASEAQIKKFRSGILDAAGALGQTPEHLSEGLYHVVSSMNKVLPAATATNEELKIMGVAARGAAVGSTSMEETTYALASAMNALHQKAGDAEKTMALLNAIVGSGDMTMGDLLNALKSGLIPTAQTFGVSLHSVGAALAVMGDQGMRGALAGTRLRMALSLIAAPSEKSAKVLSALGMSAGEVHARTSAMSEALEAAGLSTTTMADDLRKPNGIVVALSDLREHLKASGLSASDIADVFGRAFGGGRMSASIELLSQSVGRVGTKYDQIGGQVKDFGKDWSKTQETLSFQAKQAEAAVVSLGIKLGQDLTPAAKTLLHDLEDTAKWLEQNKVAAEALAGAITGVLGVAVAAFVANKLAKMVEGLKQIGAASSWLRGGFGASSVAASSEAAAAPLTGGIGIGGARSGPGLPGSMTNPIIEAQESGQFAGLGGEAAASGAVAGSESQVKSAAAEASNQGTFFGSDVGRAAEKEQLELAGGTGMLLRPAQEQMPLFPAPGEGSYTQLGTMPQKNSPSEIFSAANPDYVPPSSVEKDLGGSLRKAAGSALDGLMKGGLVASMGVLGAQVLGSATHSKTVTSVGTDTALGAAIGTVIEPGIGTAIGGGLGAIAGALKALAGDPSADRSHGLFSGKGTPNLGATHQAKVAAEEFHKEEDELSKLRGGESSTVRRKGVAARSPRNATENARASAVENYYQEQAAGALGSAESEYVVKGKKNPGIESIINTSRDDMAKLKPIGRQAFIEMITEMVKTLEHEGRLIPGSLKKLVEQLQPQLQGLPQLAAKSGKEFTNEFLANLGRNEMLGKLSETAKAINENWAREFGLVPITTHQTLGEAETNANHDMGVLQHIMKTGTAQQREEAEKEYKQLAPALQGLMKSAAGAVKNELVAVSHETGSLSEEAVNKIESAYNTLPKSLKEKIDDAGGAVAKGLKKINEETERELKALGAGVNISVGQTSSGKGSSNSGKLHARGGLVQLGRPGEAGRDSIPMSAGGMNFVAAPGEKVAVFTRHQEAFMNTRTSDVGGLNGVFTKYNKPNYMASGGYVVRGPVSTFGPPGEPAGGTAYGSSSSAPGIAVNPDGGGNWNDALARSLAGKIAKVLIAGHSANLKVIDKGPSAVGSHGPRLIDVTGAGARAMGINPGAFPTDSIGEAIFGPGVGAATQGGSATSSSSIGTPAWTGPGGQLGQLGKAVLARAAAAANKDVQRAEARSGESMGAGGGSAAAANAAFAGAVPSGVEVPRAPWNPSGKPIDKWIVPILAWAHSHGWPGIVTSGYRSFAEQQQINSEGLFSAAAGDSNHEKPNYPGGAVDVTDPSQMLSVLAGYKGNPKLVGGVLGPVDPEHFSATGRARGGYVLAASGISPKPVKVTIPKSSSATKAKLTKPASKKTKLTASGKSDLAKKLGSVKYLAGLEDLPGVVAPFNKEFEAYSNLSTLLGQLESSHTGPVVLQNDLQYLPGLAAAGVHSGMPLEEAYAKYENATSKQGQTEALQLEGEYIKWAEGQADHRLLTPGQAGIIKPAAALAGLTNGIRPGQPIMQVQQAIKEAEVGLLGGGTGNEAAGGGELRAVRSVIGALGSALAERKGREHRLEHLKTVETARREHLKKDVERLQSASLKDKLAAAVDSAHQSERVQDASEHKAAIEENIAGLPTKNRTAADEKKAAGWKAEESHLSAYLTGIRDPVKSKKASVQRAEIAVLKNKLTQELRPLDESLSEVKGSKPLVSISGVLSEIKTISKATEEADGELGVLTGSKIPIAQLNLQEIVQGLQESAIPKAVPGTSATENGALTQQLEARLLELSTENAVSNAQFGVFRNFEANIPHFEKGGPVLDDGLAYVHKGEHVVPRDGTLVAGGGGSPTVVHLHHETHVHGNAGAFIDAVDSRIQHPDNVRVVSRQQGQRLANFPGFARAR